MLWTLFLLTTLFVYVLAFPMAHSGVHRRNHRLIKVSTKGTSSPKARHALELWTTSASVVSHPVPLVLASFNPTTPPLPGAKPTFSKAPDGSEAMQIHFEKGAYDYKGPSGGLSFYAKPIDLSSAKAVNFSYSVYFSDGFDFNKGGKLPGMYGGDDDKTAINCSGGRRDTHCWSARYMFRPDGDAELYTYLPQPSAGPQFSGNSQLCVAKPLSDCNEVYGASVARGAWKWATGAWTHVSQEITLNTPGAQDGKIKVTANGRRVIDLSGLVLRDSDEGRFRGIQMQSFFGGHEKSWASPKKQDIWMNDVTIAVISKL